MIVTVTLNPALDVTYTVPALIQGTTHRPHLAEQAGGKGVNVARTLHALGRDVMALLPLGGAVGDVVASELAESGIPSWIVPIRGRTRRTVTVVEAASGTATGFNEAGPVLAAADWDALVGAVGAALDRVDAEALVLSGKLPGGVPEDAYAQLVRLATAASVPAVVDAEGPALLAALAEHPAIVKPNAYELAATTGEADPGVAASRLLEAGAESVVASFGPEGLRALTRDGAWTATPPEVASGNPTGAGDAAVAALAVGLVDGTSWPARLADAAALSAATVLTPRAGIFDAEAFRRFVGEVKVGEWALGVVR